MNSSGLSIRKIMSSANTVLLLPFQSGCLLFHSLSKSPSRISIYAEPKCGKPASLSSFLSSGKAVRLSPLRMLLAVGFYKWSFLCWRSSLRILVYWVLLSWKDVDFGLMLFLHQLTWLCGVFSLLSINVVYYISGLSKYWTTLCIPRIPSGFAHRGRSGS